MGEWSLNVAGETGYSIGFRDETVHDVCAGLSLGARFDTEEAKDKPQYGHTIALTGGFCSQMKSGGFGIRYRFDSILVRTAVFGQVIDGTTKVGRELGFYLESAPKLFVGPGVLGDPDIGFALEVSGGLVVQLLPEARIKVGVGGNMIIVPGKGVDWVVDAIRLGVDFNL